MGGWTGGTRRVIFAAESCGGVDFEFAVYGISPRAVFCWICDLYPVCSEAGMNTQTRADFLANGMKGLEGN
jgi:hypothetical protein